MCLILAGAVPAALIALVADLFLGLFERAIRSARRGKSKFAKAFVAGTGAALLL